MSEWINTYEACEEHKNGHAGHCEKCEQERLRQLLREVANSTPEQPYDDGSPDHVWVAISRKLWATIEPLKTPAVVEVRHE